MGTATLPPVPHPAAVDPSWPALPPPTWPTPSERLAPGDRWHVWGQPQHGVANQTRRANLAAVELGPVVVEELQWERRQTAEDLDGELAEAPADHIARLVDEWTRRRGGGRR